MNTSTETKDKNVEPCDADTQSENGWVKKENWFWVFVYGLVLLYFLARLFFPNESHVWNWGRFQNAVQLPLAILLAVVFVHIFSEPIPLPPAEGMTDVCKKKELEKNRQYMRLQRRNWMIFAYSFMLLSLLLPIYMFSAGWNPSDKTRWNPSDKIGVVTNPIAIFMGCSLDDGKKELSCFPSEQQAAVSKPGEPQNSTEPAKPPAPPKSAWVLNLGGHVTKAAQCNSKCADDVCRVRGGLLIPLYVVILALMGGSISLTRRLPEYQKQANPEYVSTEKKPKLSQHEFRDFLVFQIVQFISAPLIAILAYYLVEPSTTQASVALAFMAGFASETILLMVRAMAEKVMPTSESTSQKYGTITGVVALSGDGAGVQKMPLKNAEVSLVASPQVRTLTDESGCYVLGNVLIGEHGIKVTPEKVALDVPPITDSVKIERAQEVVKKHWMIEPKK